VRVEFGTCLSSRDYVVEVFLEFRVGEVDLVSILEGLYEACPSGGA
jgi:hypothetical protein